MCSISLCNNVHAHDVYLSKFKCEPIFYENNKNTDLIYSKTSDKIVFYAKIKLNGRSQKHHVVGKHGSGLSKSILPHKMSQNQQFSVKPNTEEYI